MSEGCGQIHVGDEPLIRVILKDCSGVVDISLATTLELKLRRPDGRITSHILTIENGGLDGSALYQAVAGDFDVAGDSWKRRSYWVIGGKPFNSDVVDFEVFDNF